MSKQVRHARIGAFVLSGIFLVLASAIYVGSVRLFTKETTILFYFGESVNGLTKGSPVKYKGVTIGEVSDILLSFNQDESIEDPLIPVFARINIKRLHQDLGLDSAFNLESQEVFDAAIVDGMRAKLEMVSFITGQLYVEIDYFAPPGDFDSIRMIQREARYKEVPTVPSTMAEFGSSASSIMAKLASLDIKGLNDSLRSALATLQTSLETVNAKISHLETEQWNSAVMEVADNLKGATEGLNLSATVEALEETNTSLQTLVAKVDGAIDPALEGYTAVIEDARKSLRGVDRTFNRLDQVIAKNTDMGAGLDDTLLEVREAARALRELLEFLEMNPRSLLTGRETP
jgi:paraquat-inducible protein B